MAGILRVDVDARTVRKVIRGDRRAQEAVFRALSGPVFTMAKRVLGDEQAAEEVTQDTFVDVLSNATSLRDPEGFVGWVRTIAVNHCLMRLRSPWHRRREGMASLPLVAGDGSRQVDRSDTETALDIEAALSRLNGQTRMVVWMYCVEGYTHDEIGALFGKTQSFSKSRLARGFAALAERSDADAPVATENTPGNWRFEVSSGPGTRQPSNPGKRARTDNA